MHGATLSFFNYLTPVPYAGIIRIRFYGCDLSPLEQAPLVE
jgi:hypothetical protein